MTPDAFWPNLPAHGQFTPQDHAAHTTRRGIHMPGDVVTGTTAHKMGKDLMKFSHKPHLKMKGPKSVPRRTKTRKKRP